MSVTESTWTILACGERERGDDGAALDAAAGLDPSLGGRARIRLVGQVSPEVLVDALDEGPVLLLDAVRGIPPGTIVELPLRALIEQPQGWSATTHVLPIASVVRLAGALGACLGQGWFLGIGGSRFELGPGLSAPVRAALPRFEAAIKGRVTMPPAVSGA